MKQMKIQVITNIDIEGFHRWADAPDKVDFLRFRHRHLFNIKCYFNVENPDRELEIFMLEWKLKDYINNKWGSPAEFDGMSCEMIATDILNNFNACEKVQVLEDNKGGGVVWR